MKQAAEDIYGGRDPRTLPLYNYPEAAQALDIPRSTLRAWTVGQYYTHKGTRKKFEPLIERPDPNNPRLSFNNLSEAFVLRALRTDYGVSLRTVRRALEIAETELGISDLLIHPDLRTDVGKLFLDQVARLDELSDKRQTVMRKIVREYLKRIQWNEHDDIDWVHPFPRRPAHRGEKLIGLNPQVSFGRPLIKSVGVSTEVVFLRFEAGEPKRVIMDDYGITETEFEEARFFEGRKAA